MDDERAAYVKDPRIACQYGRKCYQKNPLHHNKYKHPPDPKRKKTFNNNEQSKRVKLNGDRDSQPEAGTSNEDVEETNGKIEEIEAKIEETDSDDSSNNTDVKINNDVSDSESEKSVDSSNIKTRLPCTHSTHNNKFAREFIERKFLLRMPDDFYQFYEFCESLDSNNPIDALSNIGLKLVGPFDVLVGKFCGMHRKDEEYLLHWRYFYDPPHMETVLKGDDKSGYHIGYYRDSPKENPIFLVENHAEKDGKLRVLGDNIFAAVNLYLEDKKKTTDPFTKLKLDKICQKLKVKAEQLGLDMSRKTKKITKRNDKILTRTFNTVGLVVPYERKTQLGYRKLAMSEKQLENLLTKIQNSKQDEKQKLLGDLQGELLTWTDIASDECDFGTGIELGLNLIAHGIEDLNQTASRYLATNFKLLKWDAFAKIAEAHMKNRRKGSNLSIL